MSFKTQLFGEQHLSKVQGALSNTLNIGIRLAVTNTKQ